MSYLSFSSGNRSRSWLKHCLLLRQRLNLGSQKPAGTGPADGLTTSAASLVPPRPRRFPALRARPPTGAAPRSGGSARARIRRSGPGVGVRTSGWVRPLRSASPCHRARRVRERRSRRPVRRGRSVIVVDVHEDRVAVLDQRDAATQRRLGRDMADGPAPPDQRRDKASVISAMVMPRRRHSAVIRGGRVERLQHPAHRAGPHSGSPPCRGRRTGPGRTPAPGSAPPRCRRHGARR